MHKLWRICIAQAEAHEIHQLNGLLSMFPKDYCYRDTFPADEEFIHVIFFHGKNTEEISDKMKKILSVVFNVVESKRISLEPK